MPTGGHRGVAFDGTGDKGPDGDKPKKKKISRQQMEEMKAAAKSKVVAEQRRRGVVASQRALIEPVPLWDDLLVEARARYEAGDDEPLRTLYVSQGLADNRKGPQLAVLPWPPRDATSVREDLCPCLFQCG